MNITHLRQTNNKHVLPIVVLFVTVALVSLLSITAFANSASEDKQTNDKELGYTDAQVVTADYSGSSIDLVKGSSSAAVTATGTIWYKVVQGTSESEWSKIIPTAIADGYYGIYYKIEESDTHKAVDKTFLGSAQIKNTAYNKVESPACPSPATPVDSPVKSALQDVTQSEIKFIEINDQKLDTPISVNGHNPSEPIHNALIIVPKGFKYADSVDYDIYIKLSDVKVTSTSGSEVNGNWTAECSNKYIQLNAAKQYDYNYFTYDYETWLIEHVNDDVNDDVKENVKENRATFKFIGGSCYVNMYGYECCRPWSKDNNLYVSYGSQSKDGQLVWYPNIGNGSWSWNRDKNKEDVVVYGSGVSPEHTIKGGYSTSIIDGCSELVFGYEINTCVVTFSDGVTSTPVTGYADGQAILNKMPTDMQKAGSHIIGWTCNKDVTLTDGETITAGTQMNPAQVNAIKLNSDITLTAVYENHTYVYEKTTTTTTDDTLIAYCGGSSTCPYFGDHEHHNKAVALTLLASNKDYDGKPAEASISTVQITTFEAFVGAGSVPTIEYYMKDESKLSSAPTNPGEYVAKITLGSGESAVTAVKAFKINPLTPEVTPPTAKTLTYNGNDQALINAGSVASEVGTLQYSLSKEGTFSADIPNGKDAGSYPIYYKFVASAAGYVDKVYETPVNAAIGQATITVTPKPDQSKTYDGTTASNISYSSSGAVHSEKSAFTGSLKLEGDAKDKGTHKIVNNNLALADDTTTGFKASNYTLSLTPDVEYTITQATITVTPKPDQSKTYDGTTASNISYSSSGAVGSETPAFTGALKLEGEVKDAGSYKIVNNNLALTNDTTSGFKASNYTLSLTPDVEYTITQATITVTPKPDQSKTYDGITPSNISYSSSGTVGSETPAFTGALKLEGDAKDAGPHKIVNKDLALNDDTISGFKADNYTLSVDNNVDYTINKATITVTPISGQSSKYEGVMPSPTYIYSGQIGSETPAFTGSLGFKDGKFDVGTHEIAIGTLAPADKNDAFLASNYQLSVVPGVEYETTQRELNLTSASASKTYDSTPLTAESVTVSKDGYAADEGDKVSYVFDASITEVGSTENTFTINWNGVNQDNYATECSYGTLEITPPIPGSSEANSLLSGTASSTGTSTSDSTLPMCIVGAVAIAAAGVTIFVRRRSN